MGKFRDLTGQKFERLTVLEQFYDNKVKYCKCVCSCENHTIKVIRASNLVRGLTKSCGCLSSELASKRRFISAIGNVFDNCEVISEYMDKDYKHIVTLKCLDCGSQFDKNLWDVKKSKMPLCNCHDYFRNPLKGKHFGSWEVLNDLYNDKHEHICLCRCSCDKHTERYVLAQNLVKGISKSCGCKTFEGYNSGFISHKGETHGDLYIDSDYMKNGIHYCDCICACGNKKTVRWSSIQSGNVVSCGHYQREQTSKASVIDLTGRIFGNLAVLGRSGTNSYGGVVWKCFCSLCGEESDLSSSTLVNGATSCGCDNIAISGSRSENEIKDFIFSICNKVGEKVRILDRKEIDLYYKESNLGIEYSGSVYHASLNSLYGDKSKYYHRDKFLLAKDKGIHLITIFDVDWETNRNKIKMYLSSLFVPQKRLMARKCEIRLVDDKVACEFVDRYHIQGSNKTMMKINYGLYYSNELYAVMSFGKLRLSKTEEGQFELHRYCVKDGYTIVGGANKLLRAFEKDYLPKYILSYSDNDYFLGGIYERLGFENKGQCKPRYYWYLHGREIKREQCMLKRLKVNYPELLQEAYDIGASNKEDYVMTSLGACKVYRSGNTKWEKHYNR